MTPGQVIYLGDGAYLKFIGHTVEFLANDHEHPTDCVSVELCDIPQLVRILQEILEPFRVPK